MEINMPVWIVAAIPSAVAAILVVCGIAMLVGPFAIPLWAATLDEKHRLRLVAAIKGANDALGPVVRLTPTDLDDRIAAVLRMVEIELGKAKGDATTYKRQAVALAIVTKSAAPEARAR